MARSRSVDSLYLYIARRPEITRRALSNQGYRGLVRCARSFQGISANSWENYNERGWSFVLWRQRRVFLPPTLA